MGKMVVKIFKRKLLQEKKKRERDDSIWVTTARVVLPKDVIDSTGKFIGLDGLKNDLRSVENVTVVNVEDSRFQPDRVLADIELKFNTRLIPVGTDAYQYVRGELSDNIREIFSSIARFSSGSRPRLLSVSRPEIPKKKS